MRWARVDAGYFTHPKVLTVGRDGATLFLALLCYSADHETDGRVPYSTLGVIAAQLDLPPRRARALAGDLVRVGLLDDHDGPAWQIHDWTEYQPTRQQRERIRERQKDWRARRSRDASRDDREDDHATDAKRIARPRHDTTRHDTSVTSPDGFNSAPQPRPDDGQETSANAVISVLQQIAELECARHDDVRDPDAWTRFRVAKLALDYTGTDALSRAETRLNALRNAERNAPHTDAGGTFLPGSGYVPRL